MTAQAAPLLNVEGIETFYGDSHILHEVSLEVADGEVVCLLGRHGAGKTTTLRSIMGLTPPRRGRLIYRGRDITRLPAFTIAQLGLGYVPEDRRIFPGLSVRDNLLVAARSPTDGQAYTLERVFEISPTLPTSSTEPDATCQAASSRC